jgi:hypothetical protein
VADVAGVPLDLVVALLPVGVGAADDVVARAAANEVAYDNVVARAAVALDRRHHVVVAGPPSVRWPCNR